MRLIDADAFADEMKKRQDACQERIDNPNEDAFWTDREHWYGVMATFSEVKLTLYAMPTVDEWISVKDRLPEIGKLALVYGSSGSMTVARHVAGNEWVVPGIFSRVTHWMPLPEPPKEVEQG